MNVLGISVGRKALDAWPVVVTFNRPGNAPVVTAGQLTLDEEMLRAQSRPAQYGRTLGEALFSGPVRDAFVRALPASQGERLDVWLELGDEALRASVRWEWLCAPSDESWPFLAHNSQTPYARYIARSMGAFFYPLARRDLSALVVAASPSNLDDFRLQAFDAAAAVERVRQSLGDIPVRVLADRQVSAMADGPPTLDALIGALAQQPAHLLHIVCHGAVGRTGETYLYLNGPDGRVQDVSATTLIDRLRLVQGAHSLPHLVFLSACESASPDGEQALGGLGQRLVRDLGFPAVVAMTERVSVDTALAFSTGFYGALRLHGNPAHALADAGAALAGRHDALVPALFTCIPGQSLFTDDRPLTVTDVRFGIDALERLLPERAPVLLVDELQPDELGDFSRLARSARQALPASETANAAELPGWLALLANLDALTRDALEMPFGALALGKTPVAYDATQPFMGMNAFQAGDRRFFFGRGRLVRTLAALAESPGLIGVFGPSGCGKSSLVLAGVVPALQQTQPGLSAVTVRPGRNPLAQLDQALSADAAASRLLVVDQFEELFTLVEDEATRRAFIDRVHELAGSLPVVLTMRSEFLDDCARYPAFYAALQAKLQHIAPMTSDEMSTAVQAQASAVNLVFEADLVNTILDDVAGEPGAMPLLQHGLLRLWQRRHGRRLAAAEYRKIGGIQQAIAQTAEGVYLRLSAEDQLLVRRVLLRLVRLDENDLRRDARRREQFEQLLVDESERAAVSRLVTRLADEKLLATGVNPATGEREVELAHEALIQHWSRLREWIEADRQRLLATQRLSAAASEWERSRGETSYLYRGARLREAITIPGLVESLNPAEQRFILKSQQADRVRKVMLTAAQAAAVIALVVLLFSMATQRRPFTPRIASSAIQFFEGISVSQIVWQDENTVYAGLEGVRDGSSLARSSDGGQTWEMLNLAGDFVNSLRIDPSDHGRIYALVEPRGLFTSTDRGATWSRTGARLPVSEFNAFAISSTGNLAIGDNQRPLGVYWSEDTGRTWQKVDGAPETAVHYLEWIDEQLFMGTPEGLFMRSPDGVWTHWQQPSPVMDAAKVGGQLFIAGGEDGLWMIDESGEVRLLAPDAADFVVPIADQGEVLVASSERVDLLRSYGERLQRMQGEAGSFIYDVSQSPYAPEEVWVAREDGIERIQASRWYRSLLTSWR